MNGFFVISLDFELFWGVRDKRSLNNEKARINGARDSVLKMLEMFIKYKICATFATVGFLFSENKAELLSSMPSKLPEYKNCKLNPYLVINNIGNDEDSDPFHFALSLIEKIRVTPGQEIGSHTYSHYYCLELGQTESTFEADIAQAKSIASAKNINIESIVFPRNQINTRYLNICKKYGISAYRGNQTSWLYKERDSIDETKLRRGLRLLDSYINISGHHCYHIDSKKHILNIPASRFLRPYSEKLAFLCNLKIRRIKRSMTYAAKNGKVFHLWWHPYNFGLNITENFIQLEKILGHYTQLKKQYNYKSLNMNDVVKMYTKQA